MPRPLTETMIDYPRSERKWKRGSRALNLVEAVSTVLADPDLEEYLPLTLRQVFYRLVASGRIENKPTEYKFLSQVLSDARVDDLIPWSAIEDRGRSDWAPSTWRGPRSYLDDHLALTGKDYRRDLLAGQEVVPEVWVEKDALLRIVYQAADAYGVRAVAGKGFASVTLLHRLVERAQKDGREHVVLYFSDLDPSGLAMVPGAETRIAQMSSDFFSFDDVKIERVALWPSQVNKFELPSNPDALKPTDPRAKKFVGKYGEVAVELDALRPPDLASLVEESIVNLLDMKKFREAEAAARKDEETIEVAKQKATDAVSEFFEEDADGKA